MQAKTDSPTAQVFDFKAVKRTAKRKQRASKAPARRAVGTGPKISFAQRNLRDEVRVAAQARI
ncbi:MAG TPA: hypothetical protein VGM81_22295 [Burkholderiaceae bacterium]|jgi:hypothetical protein